MQTQLAKITRQMGLLLPPIRKLYQQKHDLLQKLTAAENEKSQTEHRLTALKQQVFTLEEEVKHLQLKLNMNAPRQCDILQDQFIEWLRVGVIGFCPDKNIEIMDACIKHMPAGAVVEIGSFCGFSASVIAHCMRRYQKPNPFYTVDDWYFEGYVPGAYISTAFTTDDWRAHTEAAFRLAMTLSAKNIQHTHVRENSNQFFKLWAEGALSKDKGIAFAYIDGDHSYTQAKQDFENVDKFLIPGGYVFFDDSADDTDFGCKEVVQEVMKMPNYQLVFQKPEMMTNRCFLKR